MKAITLWEPWATAMALGIKHNETRSWPTNYRGELAICAAKRPLDEIGRLLCADLDVGIDVLSFGCVLCVVKLQGCQPADLVINGTFALSGAEELCGNYTTGRWVWMTDGLRALRSPVPVIGRQGLFNLPADIESKVLAQL
jgi:hypothetical protein